ncbi:MAG: hypothetical protein SGBAC_007480 [Bacillariaceae sp.]
MAEALVSSPATVPTQSASTITSTSNNNPKKSKKKNRERLASDREYGGDQAGLIYKSGIPTLRSSAHRVKYDKKARQLDPKPKDANGKLTDTTWLPTALLQEDILCYDQEEHDLKGALLALLQECDSEIVGDFDKTPQTQTPGESKSAVEAAADTSTTTTAATRETRLEDFRIPVPSTWRKVNGGKCEESQKYLSNQVATNARFLQVFDDFVVQVALPYLKNRLLTAIAKEKKERGEEMTDEEKGTPITFYYQRPPTMRLQPGPSWAKVKPHNDAQYGHQHGELNFWIPLTDREWTGVDLYCETLPKQLDFHPIPAKLGQVISFHGSSCQHYVNANASTHTRVSLDFRVGVQGFFDPYWQMKGTTDDHGRKEVVL